MNIHPPHRGVDSVRAFVRELVTIIAGVVIALALEAAVQWQQHRALAREARANIVSELHQNQSELQKAQHDFAKMTEELGALITVVHRREAHASALLHSVPFIWSLAELDATSWDTAQTTGALTYMDYQDVKRYAQVYDLQHDFQSLQQRGFSASLDVEGLATLLGREAQRVTAADLADAERKLGVAQATVAAIKEFSAALDQQYRQ